MLLTEIERVRIRCALVSVKVFAGRKLRLTVGHLLYDSRFDHLYSGALNKINKIKNFLKNRLKNTFFVLFTISLFILFFHLFNII